MALVNLMCGLPYLGDSYSAKNGMLWRRDHEAMHTTKTVFFLSVNIHTHGVACWLTWLHGTQPCILICMQIIILNVYFLYMLSIL